MSVMDDPKIINKRTYDPKQVWGTQAVDWEQRIDFKELTKKRMERARKKMKENDLGAFLFFRHNNIRYVTGTWGGMWQTGEKLFRYCVLAGDKDPVMFEVPGVDLICHKQGAKQINDWRIAKIWRSAGPSARDEMVKTFAKEIKQVLKDAGVEDQPVGIDMIDVAGYQALEAEGIEVVEGMPALQEATMIKFPEEIEILKQACTIQDAAYWDVFEMLRPGITENEIKGTMDALYSRNAERVEQITMASGGRTSPFWRNAASDKMLRYGDMLLIDICMQYNGYNTCYYRNFVIGNNPTEQQKDLLKRNIEAMYVAMNKIKPGVTTAEIAEVWEKDKFRDDEYGSVSLLQFGHSLGLVNHEPPFISLAYSKDDPVTIKENMYFAIETLTPGESESARLEENLVVTEDGIEVFSLFPLFPGFEDEMSSFKDEMGL